MYCNILEYCYVSSRIAMYCRVSSCIARYCHDSKRAALTRALVAFFTNERFVPVSSTLAVEQPKNSMYRVEVATDASHVLDCEANPHNLKCSK